MEVTRWAYDGRHTGVEQREESLRSTASERLESQVYIFGSDQLEWRWTSNDDMDHLDTIHSQASTLYNRNRSPNCCSSRKQVHLPNDKRRIGGVTLKSPR